MGAFLAFLADKSIPLVSIIMTGLVAIFAPKIAGGQTRETAKQTHDLQERAARERRREERRAETYADVAKLMQDHGKFLTDQHRGKIPFEETPDHLHSTALDARIALFGSEEVRSHVEDWVRKFSRASRMSREAKDAMAEGGDRVTHLLQLRDEAWKSSRDLAKEIIDLMRREVGTSEEAGRPLKGVEPRKNEGANK
ncbi:hypothetical protein [Saccharopolyspora tripterygii]